MNLLALMCQCFEEEYCKDEAGCLVRRRQDAKAAQDDAYKDDFSSESEQEDKETPEPTTNKTEEQKKAPVIGLLEAADVVFENSISDNF